MEKRTLKIDTVNSMILIDDADLSKCVTHLSIDWHGGSLPTIILELDANININGVMLTHEVTKIYCEKCGYELGELAGIYTVCCPKCMELNVNYG